MALEDQQVATHQQRATQLADEAEHGDTGEQLGAAEVEHGGNGDQAEGDGDGSVAMHLEAEHGGHVRAGADGDTGDGCAECPGIHPAHHPCPAFAHQATRPRVDATGNRELRYHFAEHQAHQHLAETDQQVGPEHRRTARGQAQAEQGVDADDRRQVGEAEGEVLPQAHAAFEVGAVAECFQLLGVVIDGGCTRGGRPTHNCFPH
ncbi:hypothetical protein D3C76_913990 [compost metagenome]